MCGGSRWPGLLYISEHFNCKAGGGCCITGSDRATGQRQGALGADRWAAGSVVQRQASAGAGVELKLAEEKRKGGKVPEFLPRSSTGRCKGHIYVCEVS